MKIRIVIPIEIQIEIQTEMRIEMQIEMLIKIRIEILIEIPIEIQFEMWITTQTPPLPGQHQAKEFSKGSAHQVISRISNYLATERKRESCIA